MAKDSLYQLVNPYLRGNVDASVVASSPLKAAKAIYEKISSLMDNDVKKLNFTIQKVKKDGQVGGGKSSGYFHFTATEKRKGEKAEYKIKELNVEVDGSAFSKFRKEVSGLHDMVGGKKKYDDDDDDDEDDSSSSSDEKPKKRKHKYSYTIPPNSDVIIDYYYYWPLVYGVETFVVPSFVNPVYPTIILDGVFTTIP